MTSYHFFVGINELTPKHAKLSLSRNGEHSTRFWSDVRATTPPLVVTMIRVHRRDKENESKSKCCLFHLNFRVSLYDYYILLFWFLLPNYLCTRSHLRSLHPVGRSKCHSYYSQIDQWRCLVIVVQLILPNTIIHDGIVFGSFSEFFTVLSSVRSSLFWMWPCNDQRRIVQIEINMIHTWWMRPCCFPP